MEESLATPADFRIALKNTFLEFVNVSSLSHRRCKSVGGEPDAKECASDPLARSANYIRHFIPERSSSISCPRTEVDVGSTGAFSARRNSIGRASRCGSIKKRSSAASDRDGRASQGQLELRLVVTGFPAYATAEQLYQHFSRCGPVTDAVVEMYCGELFCHVTCASPQLASLILSEDHWFDGYRLAARAACAQELVTSSASSVDTGRGLSSASNAAMQGNGKKVPKAEAAVGAQETQSFKFFVGGLPACATAADLQSHFSLYAIVSDAVVMWDRERLRSRGFGFVRLSGPHLQSAADEVLASRHVIAGKLVDVKPAVPASAMQDAYCLSNVSRGRRGDIGSKTQYRSAWAPR